ncbi:hypothetical protein [Streptomyces noursei]|uniref:hypothetical protein n=1 Tax=Streptomyces noursei TaxID=1971 RepID=UPI00045EEA5C|nr:hypothetical protein [Streptomyces noursei]AIA01196.1 hypothetical protein DC74_672 [Streptomyces noursei]
MTPEPGGRPHRTALDRRTVTRVLLQLVTAAALAVNAYVHADLASVYDRVGQQISQGTLFRLEAAVASLAALLVLLFGRRRLVWAFAFLVSVSAVGAVLLYRYVNVGTLGPLPNMYEPVWWPSKSASAIAEAVGAVAALGGLLITRPPRSASARGGAPRGDEVDGVGG